jgi:hypothetical protein
VSAGAVEPSDPDVAGMSLNGTHPVIIDPHENAALCRTMGVAPDANGLAHPSYFYIATQVGMGVSVTELCAACNFDVADGPMMATTSALFHKPLMTGQPYRVRGLVDSLVRKKSRKLGLMDLLTYTLWLDDPAGECVAQVGNVWVLPRRPDRA